MERWYDAEPSQVRAARHAVEATLAGQSCEPRVVEVAALLSTELAANAIDHTNGGRFGVAVNVAPDLVRIEVGDCGPPVSLRPQTPDPSRQRGRGLLLVDRLAAAWGVDQQNYGKSVWCEVRRGDT